MILFGLALALGLYGPKSVPLSAIGSATPAYQGIGASTNVIVSIYLMEESKAFRFGNSSLKRSSLFVRYKYTARLLVCAFALPDIVAIFLVNQNGLYQSSHTFFVMANLILHFSAATYFAIEGLALREPLGLFIKHTKTRTESARRIGRLMFWLGASAFFMILTCIGHVWLITILTTTGYNNFGNYAQEYFGVWFLLSASRILVAASQLLAVSPESALRRHIASLYGSMPVPVFSPFTSSGQVGAQGLQQEQVGVLPGS